MRKRWKVGLAAALFLALVLGYLATRGPAPPVPSPPGTFSFAVLGDAPYFDWEELQYRVVLQELESNDLAWVLHVGDIFWRPCTDEHYGSRLTWFNDLRHPVIYTPGDNEWTDCWEAGSGAFAPLDRLERIREIFYSDPVHSLGRNRLPLVSQGSREPFSEFVENARWTHEGIVVATVHLVGSMNGLDPFTARTDDDDEEAARRTEAASAWVRETFAEAVTVEAFAVVIGFHANPGFEDPVGTPYREAYEPFISVLEEEVERFGGPVLVAHGDNHDYIVDRPLIRRTTGRRLENLTRLQVPGSPEVGWVRVVVDPAASDPFVFRAHVIPPWKYW